MRMVRKFTWIRILRNHALSRTVVTTVYTLQKILSGRHLSAIHVKIRCVFFLLCVSYPACVITGKVTVTYFKHILCTRVYIKRIINLWVEGSPRTFPRLYRYLTWVSQKNKKNNNVQHFVYHLRIRLCGLHIYGDIVVYTQHVYINLQIEIYIYVTH